jgi:hypothetical protein
MNDARQALVHELSDRESPCLHNLAIRDDLYQLYMLGVFCPAMTICCFNWRGTTA